MQLPHHHISLGGGGRGPGTNNLWPERSKVRAPAVASAATCLPAGREPPLAVSAEWDPGRVGACHCLPKCADAAFRSMPTCPTPTTGSGPLPHPLHACRARSSVRPFKTKVGCQILQAYVLTKSIGDRSVHAYISLLVAGDWSNSDSDSDGNKAS